MKYLKGKMKYILILLICIFSLCVSIPTGLFADAGEVTFYSDENAWGANRNVIFLNTYNNIGEGESTNISLDRSHGTSKNLVQYKGQIPSNLANHDDCINYPFIHNDGWTISDADSCLAIRTFDRVNGDMRLYALTKKYAGLNVGAYIYTFINSITSFIVWGSSFVVKVKGFDAKTILGLIPGGAPRISKFLLSVFVVTKDGLISPYFMLCLIGFVISMGVAAYAYIKGNGSAQKFKEQVFFGLIAILIIGMSLTTNSSTLGKSLADLGSFAAEAAATTTQPSVSYFRNTDGTTSENNTNNQIALVNKIFIDSQLRANLGTEFFESNKEQSYEFWKANSGYHDTQMALYGWIQRHNSSGNKVLFTNLASPAYLSAAFNSILIQVVMLLLSLRLIGIAAQCLKGNIEILVAGFGLPIAGPLFLVNDKTRGIGKSIIFLFIIGFVRVTIFSILFDLILVIISTLLGGASNKALYNILAAIGVLFFSKGALERLIQKIEQEIDRYMHRYAPSLARAEHWAMGKTGKAFDSIGKAARFGSKHDNLLSGALLGMGAAFGGKQNTNFFNPIETGINKVKGHVADSVKHQGERIKNAWEGANLDQNKELLKRQAELDGELHSKATEFIKDKYLRKDDYGNAITDSEELVQNYDRDQLEDHMRGDYDSAINAVSDYKNLKEKIAKYEQDKKNSNLLIDENDKTYNKMKEELSELERIKNEKQHQFIDNVTNTTKDALADSPEFKKKQTQLAQLYTDNYNRIQGDSNARIQHLEDLENNSALEALHVRATGQNVNYNELYQHRSNAIEERFNEDVSKGIIPPDADRKEYMKKHLKMSEAEIQRYNTPNQRMVEVVEDTPIVNQPTQQPVKDTSQRTEQLQFDLFGDGTKQKFEEHTREEVNREKKKQEALIEDLMGYDINQKTNSGLDKSTTDDLASQIDDALNSTDTKNRQMSIFDQDDN